MKHILLVFVRLLYALVTPVKPGGTNALVTEDLLLQHQRLILRRACGRRSIGLGSLCCLLLVCCDPAAAQRFYESTDDASGGPVLPEAGPRFAEASSENVALASNGARIIADSVYPPHVADLAIDGKSIGPGDRVDANRWHSALGKPHPHWVWIRFRASARISRVVVHRADLVDYPVEFMGEFSSDGGFTFHPLFSVSTNQMSKERFAVERSFPPTVTDNFRLRILRSSHRENPNSAQLSEAEVFGEFTGEQVARQGKEASAARLAKPVLRPEAVVGLETIQHDEEIEYRSRWLRLALSKRVPRITALCWDSLGEGKVNENLLKASPDGGVRLSLMPLFPEAEQASAAPTSRPAPVELDGNVVRYSQSLPNGLQARWEIRIGQKSFQMSAAAAVPRKMLVREPFAAKFVFDVGKTPVVPLTNPRPGVSAPLPCLLHAADFGSLLVRSSLGQSALCLVGEPDRPAAQWNAFIGKLEPGRSSDGLSTLPAGSTQWKLEFSVEDPMPLPELVRQEPRLRNLPRSWLNTFQYRPDIGILANNIVSDNAIFCMFSFTDPAVFTPVLPGKIEAIQLARESLDRYFAGAHGYGVGWEDLLTDTYPSVLISAWDVIRVTGDQKLLRRWLPVLEGLAAQAEAQDRNGNGLPESRRIGLPGTAVCPTGNWWDQVNFGHEDAYVCALSYRAFQALADLEHLAGNLSQATRFEQRAEHIRTAYVPTFLNPKTGILAGWKDTKGDLHDYWFVFINGLAITYGLVPDDLANAIVDRIEAKLKEVGYTRFDLGLPGNLVPICRADYGKDTLGSPQKDDGADTFGVFENGGASACYAYFYIQALYQLGRRAEAERILWPMMGTFAQGGFQNGVGHAGEWRRWDGRPSGYEGFLADAYYAQMAVFTGHYGIGFGPGGFRLEKWSPLIGHRVPLGLKFMGKKVAVIE
jgi:hypothetical protein